MKTKKLLSILLAVVLMFGCVSISASAADGTVTVSLLGEKQAIVGEEYEVIINVDETKVDLVGGISCDVIYDESKFTPKRAHISNDFADNNEITGSDMGKVINTAVDGKVSVVLIDVPEDAKKSNWLTIVFDVKAQSSEGDVLFELENVKASNKTGTKLVTQNLKVDIVENIYAHMVDVNGASIRKDESGNIRFEAEIDTNNISRDQIKRIGFLMLPSKFLVNGDMTITEDGKYKIDDKTSVTISNGYKDIDELKEDTNKFYCYFTETTSFGFDFSFAARAYIVLNDDTVIYSDNQEYVAANNEYKKNIKSGTSSKSCIETAKAIYEIYKNSGNFSSEFQNIIVKDNWSASEYAKIVAELATVEEYLKSFN